MVEEYISVAEYAKRAGISKQEVYSLIRSPQNEAYTKKINGKIQISIELLKPAEAHASPHIEPVEESKVDAEAPVKRTDERETAVIDFLMKQIEELRLLQREIRERIASLHNNDLESVLIYRYIAYRTEEEAAEELNYSKRTVQEKIKWAIKKLCAKMC